MWIHVWVRVRLVFPPRTRHLLLPTWRCRVEWIMVRVVWMWRICWRRVWGVWHWGVREVIITMLLGWRWMKGRSSHFSLGFALVMMTVAFNSWLYQLYKSAYLPRCIYRSFSLFLIDLVSKLDRNWRGIFFFDFLIFWSWWIIYYQAYYNCVN